MKFRWATISRDHPTTGFSLRISGEGGIRRWLQHVPLLNPVQISKFLVWNRFSNARPDSSCVRAWACCWERLLLGVLERPIVQRLQRHFLESVDVLTLFILHNHSLTIDDLAMKSVARSKEATRESIRRLRSKGLPNSQSDQQTSYALNSNGSELIE